ncbi:helix-turn-helix transcriptional regulator [Hymenobacter sp. M29]|uniref:Helix-turn-helix transcriptional regulator n=1 Tax=Hymenobacter mellowenesis TaxID=3063995 RepID=A0ABT9ABV8_9BACT|nr:helix-turn-helix transcriptional regulator [Hymenobacter sp. M29]MDO7847328.1 helix-turn-helix transcriptional regulator [Hymenobacter sp. M29]
MRYSDSTLRAVRKHFGLSQADLAEYLGIDRSLLTHIEANRRPLPLGATWRLLPLLSVMPPPHGTAPAELPPDPAESTAKALKELQWRLRVCRVEVLKLELALDQQLPRLKAARHRRVLPARLAVLPPRAPLPGLSNEPTMPDLGWATRMAENAVADLAKFGVPARALLEARLAGLRAEIASLEGALEPPQPQ